MKYLFTLSKHIVFALIMLTTITSVIAQELPIKPNEQTSAGLSGKVVDTEGKPVPGFSFSIQSMRLIDGFPQPAGIVPQFVQEQLNDEIPPAVPKPAILVKTEDDGSFKTSDIQPGLVQVMAIPEIMLDAFKKNDLNDPKQVHQQQIEALRFGRMKTEMQILSIRLNKITFYITDDHGPFQELTFGLKPGTTIEDVKITVKKLLKIRAQIVYADGTPVVNADARLSIKYRGGEFASSSGTFGTSCTTDAEGYFTEYRDDPGYYTLSVTINNFSGGAGPFLINKGVHPENIVIKLDGNPVIKKPAGDKKEVNQENVPPVAVEAFAGGQRVPVEAIEGGNVRPPIARPPDKIVWIINPANGHAYAQVNCNGWHDAQDKAIKEESHLLSINDEEEQIWVQIMFRNPHFWIGLNDVEEEGVWRWDSGEPVTYTNWATHEMFGGNEPNTEKDFVAVTHFEGGWQAVSEKSPLWRIARTAIIEKDGMISKVPEPEDEPEEE